MIKHRLGNCVVCGERIYSDREYVKASEGYCCKECITVDSETEALEA